MNGNYEISETQRERFARRADCQLITVRSTLPPREEEMARVGVRNDNRAPPVKPAGRALGKEPSAPRRRGLDRR